MAPMSEDGRHLGPGRAKRKQPQAEPVKGGNPWATWHRSTAASHVEPDGTGGPPAPC